jgi:hypothetical protein
MPCRRCGGISGFDRNWFYNQQFRIPLWLPFHHCYTYICLSSGGQEFFWKPFSTVTQTQSRKSNNKISVHYILTENSSVLGCEPVALGSSPETYKVHGIFIFRFKRSGI